jgi:hypothetical protein
MAQGVVEASLAFAGQAMMPRLEDSLISGNIRIDYAPFFLKITLKVWAEKFCKRKVVSSCLLPAGFARE